MKATDITNQDQSSVALEIDIEYKKTFECPICFSQELEDQQTFQLSDCDHRFCTSCFKDYLNAEIDSFKVLKIKCPQEGCSHILRESLIKTILDEATFEKYQRFVLQKMSHRNSGVKYCPKPGCLKLFTPSGDAPFSKCQCETLICNLCGDFWHEGKACLEALDPEFEIYAKENNLKYCIMCRSVVDRVEGCIHITCPVCDYEWCWLCGREYTKTHDRECTREWSPLPPESILVESRVRDPVQERKKALKKIGKAILIFPVRCIFWPFWFFNVKHEVTSPTRHIIDKIFIIMASLFLSIGYVAIVSLILFLMTDNMTDKGSIVLIILSAILLPAFLEFGIKCLESIGVRRRWKTRNAQNFTYTTAHRPIENANKVNETQDSNNHLVIETNIKLQSAQSELDRQIQTLDTVQLLNTSSGKGTSSPLAFTIEA